MTEREKKIEELKVAHRAVRDFDGSHYESAYAEAVVRLRLIAEKRVVQRWLDTTPLD